MKSIITFFTQSSEDPTRTSATLTGLLIMAASYVQEKLDFVPFIHAYFMSPIGQQTDQILTAVGMVVGAVWFLFGLFRKFTNKVERVAGVQA